MRGEYTDQQTVNRTADPIDLRTTVTGTVTNNKQYSSCILYYTVQYNPGRVESKVDFLNGFK